MSDGSLRIDQIPICIMLNNKLARIKPIIKNLTPQHVPTNTPTQFISL